MVERAKDFFNKLLLGIAYAFGCCILGGISSAFYDEITGKDNGDTSTTIWILIWVAFSYTWMGKHEFKEKSTRW